MSKGSYGVARDRIFKEMINLNRLEEELRDMLIFPVLATNTIKGIPINDIAAIRIISGVVNDYYLCIERIFIAIAKNIDDTTPSGAEWHQELLEQMFGESTGTRSSVINYDTFELLTQLKGFRHVNKTRYGFNLDLDMLINVVKALPNVSTLFKRDIENFIGYMDEYYSINM